VSCLVWLSSSWWSVRLSACLVCVLRVVWLRCVVLCPCAACGAVSCGVWVCVVVLLCCVVVCVVSVSVASCLRWVCGLSAGLVAVCGCCVGGPVLVCVACWSCFGRSACRVAVRGRCVVCVVWCCCVWRVGPVLSCRCSRAPLSSSNRAELSGCSDGLYPPAAMFCAMFCCWQQVDTDHQSTQTTQLC
jgi:hypothetical protein